MKFKNKVSIIGGSFCSLITIGGLSQAQTTNPNVIYIMADDLGYGDLGCYGQQKIKTPSLDNMASEGMKFTQHYSGATVCAPSRCVLMTGYHTGHSHIRGNREIDGYQEPLDGDSLTVAEIFKTEGYKTGCIGKWGLGGPDSEGHPNLKGFDHFYGYLGQVQAHNYYPNHLWRNSDKITLNNDYSHDLMTEEALWFIHENKDTSFFLYLPYTIPHTKFQVPELGEYDSLQGASSNQKKQAAMISRMDRDIGRILDTLKTLDLDSNTLVIFTSDNGPHGQGSTLNFFDANGPLRGKKRDLYEGGIRVPHIAWWPGKVQAGSVSDHISYFPDFLPTCCELIGADIPENIDGKSYLPVLLQEPDQQKHEFLYWEYHKSALGGPKQGIRWGDWKGIRFGMNKDMEAPVVLFNLKDDLGETTNIASEHPEIVKKMEYLMLTQRVPSEMFNFLQPTNKAITGINFSGFDDVAYVLPNDTLQLSISTTPSNAFNKSFTITVSTLTNDADGNVTKFGELVVNDKKGFLEVVVISKENQDITDTLLVEITNELKVITSSADPTDDGTVLVEAKIAFAGTLPIEERGFCYSTSPNPTVNDSMVVSSSNSDEFSEELDGFVPGVTYYLRAYGENVDAVVYGNELTFKVENVDIIEPVKSLVFYYPFEDDFNDSSLNNNSPLVNGSPVFDNNGKFGKCLVFDGNDDYMQVSSGLFNPANQDFTFMAWTQVSDNSTDRLLFQQEDGSGKGRTIISISGNSFASYLGETSMVSVNAFNLNEWAHVALVRNLSANTLKFYINGKGDTEASGLSLESSDGEINIGRFKLGQGETRNWKGKMDEVMLFNKALNGSEVAQIMNIALYDTIPNLDIDPDAINSYLALKQDRILILPNPVESDHFSVLINTPWNTKNVTIEIYTIIGELVYKERVYDSGERIRINNNFNKGYYILKATEGERVISSKKLIIK